MLNRKSSCLTIQRTAIGDIIYFIWAYLVVFAQQVSADEANGDRVPTRAAWTTSRIIGSPEAPNPYKLVPAFPKLKFDEPMQVRWSADLQCYFVCELRGKIWSFRSEEGIEAAELVVDLKKELKSFDPQRSDGVQDVYSIAFDPDFKANRYLYVCMVFSSKLGKPLEDGTRVSRFKVVGDDSPKLELESELPIIQWLAGGHNGADLLFDNQGCLLISTGDATEPSPPDRLKTGQNISDLLASILRIDVRGATKDGPYKIPADNPFLEMSDARKEVWAFGFRNPWRMSIDRPTGHLFVGDVGWEKWEMIHRVERGSNHGWSIREGNELIQAELPVGPTPIKAPWVALSHAESASITGGFVYRGSQLSDLKGNYIFGDWVNGRVWGVSPTGSGRVQEIASSSLRIIAFEPDANGEPLVVNHLAGTNLYRLVANDRYEQEQAESRVFPRKLSETGLFENTSQQTLSKGVVRFSIEQPMWQDDAVAEHYLGLPSDSKVTVYNSPQPLSHMAMFASRLHYPAGTVLAKTIRQNNHNIETQVLYFDGTRWHGYTYIWNDEQTDAELAPREGKEIRFGDGEPKRWRVHSRTECFQCHNPWPETTLAFTPEQLHQVSKGRDSTWLQLCEKGYIQTVDANQKPVPAEACVRIALRSDNVASLEDRARSYLHANCAHCHQFGAGTGVALDLRRPNSMQELKMVSVTPEKGKFGFVDSKLIDPGKSDNSILLYRLASSSVGHMPHIGAREVDFAGVALLANWIDSMKPEAAALAVVTDKELDAWRVLLVDSSRGPTAELNAEARRRLAFQLAIQWARKKSIAATDGNRFEFSQASLKALASDSDTIISSLFEAFLPEGERVKRLSVGTRFSDIETRLGDAERGGKLFREPNRLQCSRCHQVGGEGGRIGPSLDAIGLRLGTSQLFEAIAEPSRLVDPKYQTQRVMTDDGVVITGLIESETESELVIVSVNGEKQKILVADIRERQVETQSLMPAGLLEQMTAQEMVDLLAYLSSLR